MKNRLFIIISLLLYNYAATVAQNRIDMLVERCSTSGNTVFTSVVKRDPDTREIKKEVKMLSIPQSEVPVFLSAFKSESGTGQYIINNEYDTKSHVLITDNKHKTRIYMLEYREYKGGDVMIIIK